MARAAALPPEERRAQILDAVAPVILQHGRQASTRQLAEAAGVAEGTLFRVFDSKDALIGSVVAHYIGAGLTLDRIATVDRRLPLAKRLTEMVKILISRSAETFEILHAVGPPKDPSTEERLAFRDHMLEQALRIEQAMTELIGPDADHLVVSPAQLAELLGAMVFSVSNPMLQHFRGKNPPRISGSPEAIVDLLLHGALIDSTRTAPTFDHHAAELEAIRNAADAPESTICPRPTSPTKTEARQDEPAAATAND